MPNEDLFLHIGLAARNVGCLAKALLELNIHVLGMLLRQMYHLL